MMKHQVTARNEKAYQPPGTESVTTTGVYEIADQYTKEAVTKMETINVPLNDGVSHYDKGKQYVKDILNLDQFIDDICEMAKDVSTHTHNNYMRGGSTLVNNFYDAFNRLGFATLQLVNSIHGHNVSYILLFFITHIMCYFFHFTHFIYIQLTLCFTKHSLIKCLLEYYYVLVIYLHQVEIVYLNDLRIVK